MGRMVLSGWYQLSAIKRHNSRLGLHMLKKTLSAALIATALASPVRSEEPFVYISDAGHGYTLDCNANGYVLTSVNPVGRRIGAVGALIQTIYDTETIYLVSSCDAYSMLLGNGEWAWANGGFIVDFGDFRIGFPRQELTCPSHTPSYNYANDGRCPLQ
jgi:hypothetical protein